MNKTLIVLDFNNGEVCIYQNRTIDNNTEIEDIIEGIGHKAKDCQWMVVDELKLTIQ